MEQANRRQFLMLAGATACGCMLGRGVVSAEQTTAPVEPLDVGRAADYPSDGVYDALARPHKVLVIRSGDRLYATTAICTHKRQTLRVKDGQLGCPAHSSKFDLDGRPTGGPAEQPLARFAISRRDDGQIVVDRSRTFDESQWEDPAAFVKL